MNLIDWMRATAKWMFEDRPDLYADPTEALNDLEKWMETIRTDPEWRTGLETAGFLLTHNEQDGAEEWQLHKIISTAVLYQPENECLVIGWTKDSKAITTEIDLPDVSEIED